MFTLMEVECLGACVNAPMVQINDNYYVSVHIIHYNSNGTLFQVFNKAVIHESH